MEVKTLKLKSLLNTLHFTRLTQESCTFTSRNLIQCSSQNNLTWVKTPHPAALKINLNVSKQFTISILTSKSNPQRKEEFTVAAKVNIFHNGRNYTYLKVQNKSIPSFFSLLIIPSPIFLFFVNAVGTRM